MSAPTLNNQSTVRGTDCTVLSAGATSFLGSFKSVEFAVKREFAEVTGAGDGSKSRRVIRWDFSPVTLSGYNRTGVSDATSAFNVGAHVIINFQESSSGTEWTAQAALMEVHTKVNETVNEYTLTCEIEGIPQIGGIDMVLE